MKKLFTLLFITIALQSSAQHYLWETFGENVTGNSGGGEELSRDNAGNLYVLSTYSESVVIQGDTIPYPGFGNGDLYLAKFNAQGQKISLKHFGSPGLDIAFDMTTDDSANVYIFEHTYAFNIDLGDTILNLWEDVLIKLDSSGNFKWATQIPYTPSCGKSIAISKGSMYVTSCAGLHKLSLDSGIILSTLNYSFNGIRGMCVAPNGDLVLTYNNTATTTIGGFTINTTPSASGTGGNIAILRVDTALQVKSLKAYGNFTGTAAAPVTADTNNVYVVTTANSTVYFGTDSILPNSCAFLKMDTLLDPVATTELFNASFAETNVLTMSTSGIYLGGNYGTPIILNNGDSLPLAFNGDNLIVKFDFNGNVIYAAGSGGFGATDRINDMTNDGNGTCYFSGLLYGGFPIYECMSYAVKPGMQLVAFNDSLYVVPDPIINQNGLLLTATPNFTDTVQWYLNGVAIPGATSQQYMVTQNGTYTVVYTNRFNCSKTSNSITITNVGISEVVSDFSFSVYPNPVSNVLTVAGLKLTDGDEIKICNVVGKEIYFNKINQEVRSLKIQTLNFLNGVYFIEIKSGDKKALARFVKITP
jgi:hypothetical protein